MGGEMFDHDGYAWGVLQAQEDGEIVNWLIKKSDFPKPPRWYKIALVPSKDEAQYLAGRLNGAR